MKILDLMQFFKSATQGESAELLTNGSELVVSVVGEAQNFSLTFYGQADLKPSNNWFALTAIGTDFSTTTAISHKGIYNFGIDGIGRIKAVIDNADGTLDVVGKVGE